MFLSFGMIGTFLIVFFVITSFLGSSDKDV